MFYNLFQALTHVSEACYPLLDGCRKNRQKWQSLAEQQEKNLINGESNQAKRNWDADLKTTSLSSHRRRSNREVLHSTKHCMDLDSVFATAVLFFHISIYSMTVYMPRPYNSSITSNEMEKDLQLVYTNLLHRRYECSLLECPWEPNYFIDVYIVVQWLCCGQYLKDYCISHLFASFSLAVLGCKRNAQSCLLSSQRFRRKTGTNAGKPDPASTIPTSSRKQNWALKWRSPRILYPVAFSYYKNVLAMCYILKKPCELRGNGGLRSFVVQVS